MAQETWRFGAAESLLLLSGARVSGAEVLKLALTELVASGRLRLVEGKKPTVARGTARLGVMNAAPRALFALFERETVGRDGIEVAALAKAVRKEYGSLAAYRDRVVLAAMVDQGLFAAEQYRVLWVFPATRHALTFAGQTARRDLMELRERVEADPAASMATAGAALLLMPALFAEMGEIERARRAGYGADASSGSSGAVFATSDGGDDARSLEEGGVTAPDVDPTPVPGFDFSSLDFGALDAIGGLDAAFSAIDAGVSDGGGGGSDGGGGGGDGGGGGGGDGGV